MVNLFMEDMTPFHKFKSWDTFNKFCERFKLTHVEVGEYVVVLEVVEGIPQIVHFAQEEK